MAHDEPPAYSSGLVKGMSYRSFVPPELRSRVLTYLPPEEAEYGVETMEISAEELIRQMRELGLNPATIIATERARQRDIRSRQRQYERVTSEPAGLLFRILREHPKSWVWPSAYNAMPISTDNPNLYDAVQQLGYTLQRAIAPLGRYDFRIMGKAEIYDDLRRLYEREIGPAHVALEFM